MSANAETVLSTMFAEYKRRIACGIPYSKAVQFRSDWCGLADVWDDLIDADQVEWLGKGVVALRQATILQLEDVCRKNAENESKETFNRKLNIFNALVPFILFVLGLLVEHYAGIIDWLRSLF